MRITRVYTRTGDKGTTRLANGTEVHKSHPRICAYGTVDELNAVLGLCIEEVGHISGLSQVNDSARRFSRLHAELQAIQHDLFNIGGDLATPVESRFPQMVLVGETESAALERLMDEWNADLQPLKDFILPGGSKVSALFHLARTVCRRAEREAVSLSAAETINSHAIIYLNRLSDYFFVTGRWVQASQSGEEVTWNKAGGLRHFVSAAG